MQNISKQAKELIADFKKRIEMLPAHERDEVRKKMTAELTSLNEDMKSLLYTLRPSPPETHRGDIDRIADIL